MDIASLVVAFACLVLVLELGLVVPLLCGFLVHLTKQGLRVVGQAVEHLARHSALGPAMSQLTQEERRQGSAFALRVLAALERSEEAAAAEEEEESTASPVAARPKAARPKTATKRAAGRGRA